MDKRPVPRRRMAGFAFLLVLGLLLAFAVPALADYLGPDRHVVDMVEVRDPSNDFWTCGNSNPPPGILGTCILHHPDNPCPDAGGHHPSREQQQAWCQWGSNWSDYTGCGCTEAYAYETIEYDLPPATISGSLTGCTLQNGWCVTSPSLNLQGAEPLAGYEIVALEGTRNSDPFACPGALCDVPLLEGANAFTIWALSSYGDSSTMGSLSAQVDTVPPATAFLSPSEGSSVWVAGTVVFSGLSGDATSGLASAEISLDGGASWRSLALSPDGSWSYSWDTRPEGDAAHAVLARAYDQAGNLGNEAQVVLALDNTSPSVDLPGRWMIWEPIALQATDGGSGIQRLELTIQGRELGVRKYFLVTGQGSWVWDRRFEGVLAPIGEYGVSLEAWDALGNQGSDHGILVIPDPGAFAPTLPEREGDSDEEPDLAAPSPTESSPSVTFPPFVGPTPTSSGVEALAGLEPEGPQSSTEETVSGGDGSGVLWGAAALAAIGAATAYVLTKKREREEEHEAELAQKKAQAAEWAAKAAALHKQVDANIKAATLAAAQKAQAALLAGSDADEWQEEELAARHARQDQAREAREERLAWQERQAEEAAARAEAARLAAAAAAAESLRETAERRDAPAPELVDVPSFFSSPVGWLEATLINAGRRDAETRDRLTRTLAPLVDPLRAVADHDRNPSTASFHDAAWERIHAVEERRRDYVATANEVGVALSENRRQDALRGVGHLGEIHLQGARDAVATQLGMLWGLVTTPVRLVTRSVPAFVTAVSERLQGRDRGWDVVFTGTMVEADLLGSYYLAQPTGLVERANLALERRVFGSLEAGAPNELLPAGVTGQWRDWTLPQGITTAEQAVGWQSVVRQGIWGPLRELDPVPGPMTTDDILITLPAQQVSDLPLGAYGDRSQVLLWTADERGVNFIPEQTAWPTSRVSTVDPSRTILSHTNISRGAYAGGEAWRTGPNELTITSASGAYGYSWQNPGTWVEGAARFEAVVDFLEDLGIDVVRMPFGAR